MNFVSDCRLMQADSFQNLTVVVTHYKTPDLLVECLTRLETFAPDATLIVVDSSSGDGTLARLEAEFPNVKAVRVANHSMANGVNAGLKRAQTSYILQMNADVMIEPDTLPAMVQELTQPDVGMVGPRCRTSAGGWQRQGLGYYLNYALLDLSRCTSVVVPWLSGCCQMTKHEVLARVGGLDSSLRFYNEDIEWCWRVRRAGYTCRLLEKSVLHVGGASTPNDPKFMLEGFRGAYVLSQRYKSALYRSVHRRAVQLYASYKMRTAETPGERQTYRALLEMFREARVKESPFGSSLDQTNPYFLHPLPN